MGKFKSSECQKNLLRTKLSKLALTLNSRVTLQINTMIDQVGLNDDETLATEMTSVGNTTVEKHQLQDIK